MGLLTMVLQFENVTFSYGGTRIFTDVNFSLHEGERAGLLGANGEGKTTLFKLALGELSPENGNIYLKNGVRVGYLEQNGGYESERTVYAEMREVFAEDFADVARLNGLFSELSALDENAPDYAGISAKIEALQKKISSRGSYEVDVKIKTVLNGMGFGEYYGREISTLSGGEKTRLKLARLLLEQPDLLLLDEPTNHLDIPTLAWLEDYLSSFGGALFIVSHDRFFLDRTISRVIELENGSVVCYAGNYSKYKTLKAERLARLEKEYEALCLERAKMQEYIAKNIVRATTAKSAQSRVKQLQKLPEPVKPYRPPKPPAFSFAQAPKSFERVLQVSGLNLVRGNKTLAKEVNFTISRGRKIALIGANGTGKTSLLKDIMRAAGVTFNSPESGSTSGSTSANYGANMGASLKNIAFGREVKCAYFDQEALNLDPESTVLEELWRRHVGATQTDMRSALARCGLPEEDMQKKVKQLSGGERAKLALCVAGSESSNFLILDEPTNHLDLPARESLERALGEYGGTILFVSHDRYLISSIADGIFELNGGKLNIYEGNYAFYERAKGEERAKIKEAEEREKQEKRRESVAAGYRSKRERAEEAKLKERIRETEKAISDLEAEEAEIYRKLALPDVASDYVKVSELSARLSQIKNSLDLLYAEYADMIQ